MKKIFLVVFFIVFTFSIIFPMQTDAAGLVPCGGCNVDLDPTTGQCPAGQEQDPCNFCHIFALGNNILSFLLIPSVSNPAPIVLVVATLLFAVGGFFFFISAGSTARLERGKQIITATIIGLLIIYGAWLFIGLLLNSLGVTGSWWEIDCAV